MIYKYLMGAVEVAVLVKMNIILFCRTCRTSINCIDTWSRKFVMHLLKMIYEKQHISDRQ